MTNLRIGWHLLLSTVAEVIASAGCAIGTVFLLTAPVRIALGLWAIVPVGAAAYLGLFVVRSIVRRQPAVCPKCGGRTYQTGIKPICYACQDCGHVHATGISSNI